MHVGIKDQRIREFVRNATKVGQGAPAQIKTPGGAVLERHRLARGRHEPARQHSSAGSHHACRVRTIMLASTTPTTCSASSRGSVELVVLEDCYHMVTVDRQRHIVLDRTSSFIGMISSVLNAGVRSAEAYARFPRVASA